MISRKVLSCFILFSLFFWDCSAAVCQTSRSPWHLLHILKAPVEETPMNNPTSLYIDRENRRYYVVDYNNSRLLSFSEAGEFINTFNGAGQLAHPFDMIKDGRDIIIVLERNNNTLTKILLQEKELKRYHISYKGKTITPYRIEAMADAMIILDRASGRLFLVNYDFEVTDEFASPEYPEGFSNFIVKGNIVWGLTSSAHRIIEFSPDNNELNTIIIDQTSSITNPVSFDIDNNGNIYILDRFSRKIAVFTSKGTYQYSFLKKGIKAPDLAYPIEIKFDFNGNLCVLDEGNGKVGVYSR